MPATLIANTTKTHRFTKYSLTNIFVKLWVALVSLTDKKIYCSSFSISFPSSFILYVCEYTEIDKYRDYIDRQIQREKIDI